MDRLTEIGDILYGNHPEEVKALPNELGLVYPLFLFLIMKNSYSMMENNR